VGVELAVVVVADGEAVGLPPLGAADDGGPALQPTITPKTISKGACRSAFRDIEPSIAKLR